MNKLESREVELDETAARVGALVGGGQLGEDIAHVPLPASYSWKVTPSGCHERRSPQ